MVVLQQVQVYERISPNLLPWSMAMDLDLPVYSDKILTLTLTDQVIQTSQYCKFIIRVAGIDAKINVWMILGLQSVILGRDWIHTVNLFSDFGKQNYFIPVPLNVEAATEDFPNIRVAQTYEDDKYGDGEDGGDDGDDEGDGGDGGDEDDGGDERDKYLLV
jgi:hypothetical protein